MSELARTPIAVIGMACRLPGADGLGEFWNLLCSERHAVRAVPSERYPAALVDEPASAQWGGFVEDGDCFDAAFFGITAQEAERMDPQQGMMLEMAWASLEDAGIAPDTLRGRPVGVFAGVSTSDFDRMLCRDHANIDLRAGTGTSYSIIANRISYTLGLRGPSLAVDLACSSSLAAVHLACQSLWLEECELALAGGVHLMLAPEKTLTFARGGVLSAAGSCRSFSSAADGYVRGEGCGMVLLQRLDAALRTGSPIIGLIRGSAVNHNGKSNGLSAPSGLAQRSVIVDALAVGRVDPLTVNYVEAHSPGTVIGDMIEVQALKGALCDGRPIDQPCLVGSLKPSIGHLEGAAGIASLVKVLLALERGWIPKSLRAQPLNDGLKLHDAALRIAEASQAWPTDNRPRRAGVSCFSFGGANAHVVLEQAPAGERMCSDAPVLPLLLLSARSADALKALAARFAKVCSTVSESAGADGQFAGLRYTAAVGRTHFAHRLAVIARDAAQTLQCLEAFAADATAPNLLAGVTVPRRQLMVVLALDENMRTVPVFDALARVPSQRDAEVADRRARVITALSRCGVEPDAVCCPAHMLEALRECAPQLVPRWVGDNQVTAIHARRRRLVLSCAGSLPCAVAADERRVDVTRLPGDANGIARLMAELYIAGCELNWRAVFGQRSATRGLPTYPFERRRRWSLQSVAGECIPQSPPRITSKYVGR